MLSKTVFYPSLILCGFLIILQTGCSPQKEYIGVATMEEDGTIVFYLGGKEPGGLFVDGIAKYPPGHPEYNIILEHLNGLKPGEGKLIAPFPDEDHK